MAAQDRAVSGSVKSLGSCGERVITTLGSSHSEHVAAEGLLVSVYSRAVATATLRALADLDIQAAQILRVNLGPAAHMTALSCSLAEFVFEKLIISDRQGLPRMAGGPRKSARKSSGGQTRQISVSCKRILRQSRQLTLLRSRQARGRQKKQNRRSKAEYVASEGIAVEATCPLLPCGFCNTRITGAACCLAGEPNGFFVAHFGCLREWRPDHPWQVGMWIKKKIKRINKKLKRIKKKIKKDQ
jgi:hypothetical protein